MVKIKPHIKESKAFKVDFKNYIDVCRWIVNEHQYLTINDIIVDPQSAHVMVIVFDSMNKKNQNKVLRMPIEKFNKFAWGMVR